MKYFNLLAVTFCSVINTFAYTSESACGLLDGVSPETSATPETRSPTVRKISFGEDDEAAVSEINEIVGASIKYYKGIQAVSGEIKSASDYNRFLKLFSKNNPIETDEDFLPIFKLQVNKIVAANIDHLNSLMEIISSAADIRAKLAGCDVPEDRAADCKELTSTLSAAAGFYINLVNTQAGLRFEATNIGLREFIKGIGERTEETAIRVFDFALETSKDKALRKYFENFNYQVNFADLIRFKNRKGKPKGSRVSQEGAFLKIKVGPVELILPAKGHVQSRVKRYDESTLIFDSKLLINFNNLKLPKDDIGRIISFVLSKIDELSKKDVVKAAHHKTLDDAVAFIEGLPDHNVGTPKKKTPSKGSAKKRSTKKKAPKKKAKAKCETPRTRAESVVSEGGESATSSEKGGALSVSSKGSVGDSSEVLSTGMSEEEIQQTLYLAARQYKEGSHDLRDLDYKKKEFNLSKVEKYLSNLMDYRSIKSLSWHSMVVWLRSLEIREVNGRGEFAMPFDSGGNHTVDVRRKKRLVLHRPHGTGDGENLYPTLVRRFLLPILAGYDVLIHNSRDNTYTINPDYISKYVTKD